MTKKEDSNPISDKPISIWCRLGFHAWGAWTHHHTSNYGDVYQQRQCLSCGLLKIRDAKYDQ